MLILDFLFAVFRKVVRLISKNKRNDDEFDLCYFACRQTGE